MNNFQLKVYFLLIILLFAFIYNIGNPVSYALIILILVVLYKFSGTFFGSSWKPAKKDIVAKIAKEVKGSKIVYDLGSGDGRLVIASSKNAYKAYGIEIDPIKYLLSTMLIKLKRIKNAKIILGSFFDKDIYDADTILLYLPQETVDKLQKKFKNLKKGAKIISYGTLCKELKLVKENKKDKIYVYRV